LIVYKLKSIEAPYKLNANNYTYKMMTKGNKAKARTGMKKRGRGKKSVTIATTPPKVNLFMKAKERGETEEPKVVNRAYTVKTKRDFDGAVERFMNARDALEDAKSEHETSWEELMDISIDKWAERSKLDGAPCGTLMLHTKSGANVKIIPTTRFKVMTADQAAYLRKIGYDWAIEEETTYSFNQRILKKHMDKISQLIQECEDIPEEDKDRLFTAKTKYLVKKTNIDTDKRFSLPSLIRDLGRVFMLKCPKLTK